MFLSLIWYSCGSASTFVLGNSVSIEAVAYVYQTEMLEQLKRTGRPEMVVGWYHSHPGFGCWFSGSFFTFIEYF